RHRRRLLGAARSQTEPRWRTAMKHVDFPQARGRIGLASVDITPPVGIYHRMWGAAVHDKATGVHRPLKATALWTQPVDGPGGAMILALDHCILDRDEIDRMATAVGKALGIERQ